MSDGSDISPSQRERELCLAALDTRTPAGRPAFLDASWRGAPTLRERVEALLREEAEVRSFLETPAVAGALKPSSGTTHVITPGMVLPSEKPGEKIGRYKLLQNIGEGGCGVVY